MKSLMRASLLGSAVWAAAAFVPSSAAACGGFFCNTAQPVNQAAEGILFADNGDGTTTAVIQIQYQGPSQRFSWLLPISSVPKSDADIGVASNLALQRLQLATNPKYTLTVQVEGSCRDESSSGAGCGASGKTASGAAGTRAAPSDDDHGVTVEASGIVGSFEWSVISPDRTLPDPASAAVDWLQANGYDVPSGAPKLLGPYLEQGLFLLALRLAKGADTGSIHPILLNYVGQPSIPLKLTAVTANDDMGILAWVLGGARAVPENYLSLDLNEARINWFSPGSNYNAVVTEAANDAGGQGFVTEFSGSSASLAAQIWTPLDETSWRTLNSGVSDSNLFSLAYQAFGQWDGFWDALRAVATLPDGLTVDALKACPSCYVVPLAAATYLPELDKDVIQPVKRVQALIDGHPRITRLYTTLSADEMTVDPAFAFNADLPDVSNVHTAKRVIECSPNLSQSDAPWHIELPQGDTVWGSGVDASLATWSAGLSALPPNRSIGRAGKSGTGQVLEDNSSTITAQLKSYNAGKEAQPESAGGCIASGGRRPSGALLAAIVVGATVVRRRRRR